MVQACVAAFELLVCAALGFFAPVVSGGLETEAEVSDGVGLGRVPEAGGKVSCRFGQKLVQAPCAIRHPSLCRWQLEEGVVGQHASVPGGAEDLRQRVVTLRYAQELVDLLL